MKIRVDLAKKHLAEIRRVVSQSPSPLAGMSKDQAIDEMRKVREELWENKFAARS